MGLFSIACTPDPEPGLELPGELVVYETNTGQHLRYAGSDGFVHTTGHTDGADLSYDPSRSPDQRWQIRHRPDINRYVVLDSSGVQQATFQHWCFALSQIAWSPDSRWIAYRADHDEAEWTGRIMVMAVPSGQTTWIGTGESPRWYSDR